MKLYERSGWTFILIETVLLYVIIYAAMVFKWPMREYLRFVVLLPLMQASVKFGVLGSIVEGSFVTLLYFPIPVIEYAENKEVYMIFTAVCMLVFMNLFGVYMGSVVGRSRRNRTEMKLRFEAKERIESQQSKNSVMTSLMSETLRLIDGIYACMILADGNISGGWRMYGMKTDADAPVEITDYSPRHPLIASAETGDLFASNSVLLSDRFDGRPESEGFRAMICVPVASSKKRHGALLISGKQDDESFTQKDMDVIQEMCDWTAAVIEKQEEETNRLRELAKRDRMTDIFSKYASETVARTLMDNPEILKGSEREVTVLVSDIMGFTSISEKLAPREIVSRLNRYFSIMVDIIIECGGTIDKFVGDCVIAYWGAPLRDDDHAVHAVEAAKKIHIALDELNAEWRRRGGVEFRTGIGIHTCRVIAGGVGGEGKKSYTIMGDEVDKAMEMETLTREYNEDVLLSESVVERIRERIPVELIEARADSSVGKLYRVGSC